MKIVSWNVNGIRSAQQKGLLTFISEYQPDILCLQEIKCSDVSIPTVLKALPTYTPYFNFASKNGYSGVAIYSKIKPEIVSTTFGTDRFKSEGRFLELRFKDFILFNLYLPHGGREKQNLDYKLESYSSLFKYLTPLAKQNAVLVGDFNIAHEDRDLARPSGNRNNIMFTPQEREQITKLISLGFVDSFRQFQQDTNHYTWWPYRAGLRERNIGWRIDYGFVSKPLVSSLSDATILPMVKGSDHCPIELTLW